MDPNDASEAPDQQVEGSAEPPSDQSKENVGDETGSDEAAADEDLAPEASEGEGGAE